MSLLHLPALGGGGGGACPLYLRMFGGRPWLHAAPCSQCTPHKPPLLTCLPLSFSALPQGVPVPGRGPAGHSDGVTGAAAAQGVWGYGWCAEAARQERGWMGAKVQLPREQVHATLQPVCTTGTGEGRVSMQRSTHWAQGAGCGQRRGAAGSQRIALVPSCTDAHHPPPQRPSAGVAHNRFTYTSACARGSSLLQPEAAACCTIPCLASMAVRLMSLARHIPRRASPHSSPQSTKDGAVTGCCQQALLLAAGTRRQGQWSCNACTTGPIWPRCACPVNPPTHAMHAPHRPDQAPPGFRNPRSQTWPLPQGTPPLPTIKHTYM